MSSKDFSYDNTTVPSGKGAVVAVVATEWNSEITDALLDGAVSSLKKYGVDEEDIQIYRVPGTFELSFAAKQILEYELVDAVIVLGTVIQGETRHFDFICQGVTQGITELNLYYDKPVIFGVLTTENMEQARDRSGGKLGNKGAEAAIAALKMINFNLSFEE
ncbi:MAG: 6,7-dimethyl-8-ribityllumazine synthase [Candidatus Zixiibacteriota bacterium]|nr:MAG: 6,7-dimethyl-8-ribityllumazine synthase [candidate division Zixibacteria bacterium]